jgi:hypothetical protein
VTTTESYWIIGPAASVALGAGVALDRAAAGWRRGILAVLGVGTAYTTAAALFLTLPEPAQAAAFAAMPALRGPFASGVYAFAPLAARLRTLAAADDNAVILTDRYETSAELLRYNLDSRLARALPQQAQWTRWHAGLPPVQHALLVTYAAPLTADPDLEQKVRAAFARITPLPDVKLSHAGISEDTYYVIQLDNPRPDLSALLGL